jgi:hypothetical protein
MIWEWTGGKPMASLHVLKTDQKRLPFPSFIHKGIYFILPLKKYLIASLEPILWPQLLYFVNL